MTSKISSPVNWHKIFFKTDSPVKRLIIQLLMLFFALLAIIPIYVLIINATRSTEQINLGLTLFPSNNTAYNWNALTSRGFKIWQGFFNSAIIAVSATVLSIYFSALTAYGLHVYRFRGRVIVWTIILVIMMLPGSLTFIGFYQLMATWKLTDTYIPLIIPAIAAAATVLFIRQYMSSVLSLDLIDAARIDGAGEYHIFNFIVLPVIIPALAAQSIFTFVGSWNNFITPFIMISSQQKYTLPMLVMALRGDIYRTEFGGIYLGIAVSLIPIIIFYCFMSRFIISGITMGGIKE
jgi:multiple sugar transport system permease protein